MRNLLKLVLLVLGCSQLSHAQIATQTKAGLVKGGGTGVTIGVDGTINVTAPTSTNSSYNLGTLVTDKTSAGIKAVIDALPVGGTMVLDGSYNCSAAGFVIDLNKGINVVGINGATLDGGTTNAFLMKIYNFMGGTIKDVTFQSQKTGGDYALIFCNEQGDTKNLHFTRCKFICPQGQYNCLGFNAFNTFNGVGVMMDNITFDDCEFTSGRMGVEMLAHNWNGTVRISNVSITNCRFLGTGLNDPAGMAWSFSGDVRFAKAQNNLVRNFKSYAGEFIGTTDFVCSNNIIESAQANTSGISCTDGGNTEANPSNPNRGAKRGTISGNVINVTGRSYIFYFATDINITGDYSVCGQWSFLQHARRLDFNNVTMVGIGACEALLYFDETNDSKVIGGRYDLSASTNAYQRISFSTGSSNNHVMGSDLIGTNSGNGSIILDNGGGVNNKWVNIWVNNQLTSN